MKAKRRLNLRNRKTHSHVFNIYQFECVIYIFKYMFQHYTWNVICITYLRIGPIYIYFSSDYDVFEYNKVSFIVYYTSRGAKQAQRVIRLALAPCLVSYFSLLFITNTAGVLFSRVDFRSENACLCERNTPHFNPNIKLDFLDRVGVQPCIVSLFLD